MRDVAAPIVIIFGVLLFLRLLVLTSTNVKPEQKYSAWRWALRIAIWGAVLLLLYQIFKPVLPSY